MPQKWENSLLMEAEGLQHLNALFQGFDNLLEKIVDEYGDYLDLDLILVLEMVRFDTCMTLNGVVPVEKVGNIPGILKQLEDVMDEIQTLQAGKETKHGVKDENGG